MARRLTVRERIERLLYRIAGLPVALRVALAAPGNAAQNPPAAMDRAFARSYWHPHGLGEWTELAAALALWPIVLLGGALWFTARNGRAIRKRTGTGAGEQFLDQLKLYFDNGVLAPWYYIFGLHEGGAARSTSYIQRFETKSCYFAILKRRKGTPLNDKRRFAEHCSEHGLRCVETLMHLDGSDPGQPLPELDLFVKRARGRGGRGAERWDLVGPSRFAGPAGELDGRELLERLVERSRRWPLLVQPRLLPHEELLEITSGALPTLRVLTCLDRDGQPEVIAAMLRTSFGGNRTVDNLHAGGIGALVELGSGILSKASNLGADSRLGWFSVHPDTGGRIEGRRLPFWDEVRREAAHAHRAFCDRVVIGWDISILQDGPILVEGNGNPDLDILQRFMPTGLRQHRFAELLAFHLRQALQSEPAAAFPRPHSAPR